MFEECGVVEVVGGALNIFVDKGIELKEEVLSLINQFKERCNGIDG